MRNRTSGNKMIGKLFFNMLPVQILIFAIGSVNSIVDGAMAGRFIDSSSVGVVGLYYSMVNIINAAGSVLLGGTAVLCGRFMGRGDIEETEGVFSLDMSLTFIGGAFFTLISLMFPGYLADILGADTAHRAALIKYIIGYAIGIIPMLFSQQIAAFLQLERQSRRGYIGIAGMTVSNVFFDIVLVGSLRMGIFGLALATSLSNIVYFFIIAPYYLTKKAQLHFNIKKILWRLAPSLLKIGFPGALLVFCIAIRGMVINRILLKYSGSDGLSAMASFSMVCGLLIAFCLGNGSVVRMLVSVFVGEEDRDSIKQLFSVLATKALALSALVALAILLLSKTLAGIFFPDPDTEVYILTYRLFMIYALCIPMILICQVQTNYLQAMGHTLFVNFISVFDGFFSMVIPSLILAPILGALGVWLANPIGIILTILTVPLYRVIRLRRIPRTHDDLMFFMPDFGIGPEDSLFIDIKDNDALSQAAVKVQEFCADHEMEQRSAYYSALCLEELAGNVIIHGFSEDGKTHSLTVLVISRSNSVILRIKDDCRPFDIREMAEIVRQQDDPFANIGIRMVYSIADDVNYRNLLGLNILTIEIHDRDLTKDMKTDYLLERTLAKLDPDLHRRFSDTVFVIQKILSRYRVLFPEYTDHSELHSMTVIDCCNRIIGQDQIGTLNADEIYILLEAAYLHDVGMGISEKDYEEFKDRLDYEDYFAKHSDAKIADFVRDYHNEFSGLFIEKYAQMFDIPSPEHTFAIIQVARGHRKTDLFDEKEYPAKYMLPNGNTVCLPYLAALIRIADEIDVVASRNPLILFDIELLTDNLSIIENKKLAAVKEIKMTYDAFILTAKTDEREIEESIGEMVKKMQKTLDTCRNVIHQRTNHYLSQKKIVLKLETNRGSETE